MAIKSINKEFTKKSRDVSLLAKDFSTYKQRLTEYAKTYFPNTYNDFSETSIGSMFIELVSYAGDVLSYNIDYNFKESLLSQASEDKNIIRLAQSLGYKVPLTTSSVGRVKLYQLLPNNGSNSPDWNYALRVNSNLKIRSSVNSNIQFRTNEVVDFSDMQFLDNVNEFISVHQETAGVPDFYLIEYYKQISVISGVEKSIDISVGDAQQFFTIELPENNVSEIISIVDSDGNTYYEVDYLAQDTIFTDVELTNSTQVPFYQPRLTKVPRRFISRVNKDLKKEIQFGSGITDDNVEDVVYSINQSFNQLSTSDLSIDPRSFSTSTTYGKVPSNTTLTIRYTVDDGVLSNVASNQLTDIFDVSFLNDETILGSGVSASTLNQIKQTLTVINEEPTTGGKNRPTVNEIRENALRSFSSQKRCVTAEDYKFRILSLPSRYGSIAKAYVTRHDGSTLSNSPTIDAFILSYNSSGQLQLSNTQTKKNLSLYLNEYRMLTDGVNILDGYIVNIGVDFEISVYTSYNKNEVLLKSIEAVKKFFEIDRMDFSSPIYLNDLELQIGNIEGVRTVNYVNVFNKTRSSETRTYSQYVYPIESATRDKIIYPSIEPSIFEVKYPNSDIKGKVK